ncbi:MAG TPA: aminotransferase class V-fold PLP-dependent enzyme [Burkholderiaceae bacterium]
MKNPTARRSTKDRNFTMEIYLDANATTPVIPIAREAALAAMSLDFGNPSSTHSRGLQAKSLKESVRASARRVLGAASGQLLFVSGATEGIQTAVLSALTSLKNAESRSAIRWLLYGATEHKAVAEALAHWNAILGLNLEIRAIPVGQDGRHDLAWLRQHAPQAGMVCTMAANNETGVISDLEGIAQALKQSPALWMVDGVQALGKLPLQLQDLPIDYAPFSGHKLYAPKGIGLLYVREGAPFTPLIVGGGQEGAWRSGTENMAGIAALGAVLSALEGGTLFQDHDTLHAFRRQLMAALRDAFPNIVFNAPLESSLPTTVNFSVPGVDAGVLLNLFDAAGVRVSGGSACGAAKARPSYVLEAMGLPDRQIESAIRMSFGPADTAGFIDEACARIRTCGESLRQCGLFPGSKQEAEAIDGLTRLVAEGTCCYVLSDSASRQCIVIDPWPQLTPQLRQLLTSRNYAVAAILETCQSSEKAASAAALRTSLMPHVFSRPATDTRGWPIDTDELLLGDYRLTRLPAETDATATYLLSNSKGLQCAFAGDAFSHDSIGQWCPPHHAPTNTGATFRKLAGSIDADTLLLPGQDHEGRLGTTLEAESKAHPWLSSLLRRQENSLADAGNSVSGTPLELDFNAATALTRKHGTVYLVDVREAYEQRLSPPPDLGDDTRHIKAPLSRLPGILPELLSNHAGQPFIFFCRSGNRSAQAARSLRGLGHEAAWSLAGGLALWPQVATL